MIIKLRLLPDKMVGFKFLLCVGLVLSFLFPNKGDLKFFTTVEIKYE